MSTDRDMAQAILTATDPERLGLRQGVVVTADAATWSVTAYLSGDTDSAVVAKVIGHAFPSVGDTVWMLSNGSDKLAVSVSPGQPRTLDSWQGATVGTWYGPGSSEAVPNASGEQALVSGVLVTGCRYRITVAMPLQSTVGTDVGLLRIREDSIGGAARALRRCGFVGAATADVFLLTLDFDAVANGSKSFVSTVQRSSGTGNMTVVVAVAQTIDMSLELIGGPSVVRTG